MSNATNYIPIYALYSNIVGRWWHGRKVGDGRKVGGTVGRWVAWLEGGWHGQKMGGTVRRWVAWTGGKMSLYICSTSTNTVGWVGGMGVEEHRGGHPPHLHNCSTGPARGGVSLTATWVEVTVSRISDCK